MRFVKKINDHHRDIDGVLEIELDPFEDHKGQIWSIYENCDMFPDFVEDKITISKKNVLRGLHGDKETHKLICCLSGEIFLAIADIRSESETFGKTMTFHLSDKEPKTILVPAGCLNGHLCLSEKCLFFYKWSKKYNGPDNQITVKWDDPLLGINWPTKEPILSKRDQDAKYLKRKKYDKVPTSKRNNKQ